MVKLTFEEWLTVGIKEGYCSPEYCSTHDAGFMTEAEEQEWDKGNDPCCHVVRLGNQADWLNN